MFQAIQGLDTKWRVLVDVGIVAAFILAVWGLTALTHLAFRKVRKKHKELHLAFFERLSTAVIVVACVIFAVSAISGAKSVWQTLLGGTAIISAVLAFAAQDVIKDILAGLVISVNKPFAIGDRIVLEDGTAGIVEDMTTRHVVIHGIDTQRYIIPNSKINSVKIENMSVGAHDRSALFRFPVGYDTDIALAKKVIADAVAGCERTVPSPSTGAYTDAYFTEFADSALIITITAYYERTSSTERVKDEVNTKVRAALNENGIEIPYNYINVVTKTDGK